MIIIISISSSSSISSSISISISIRISISISIMRKGRRGLWWLIPELTRMHLLQFYCRKCFVLEVQSKSLTQNKDTKHLVLQTLSDWFNLMILGWQHPDSKISASLQTRKPYSNEAPYQESHEWLGETAAIRQASWKSILFNALPWFSLHLRNRNNK